MHGWWTTNVTTFGMPVGLAASFDTELMRRVADVIGEESRVRGGGEREDGGRKGVVGGWMDGHKSK